MVRYVIAILSTLIAAQPLLGAGLLPCIDCPAPVSADAGDEPGCCDAEPATEHPAQHDPAAPERCPDGSCPKLCCVQKVSNAVFRVLAITPDAPPEPASRTENQRDPHAEAHASGVERPPSPVQLS